MDNFNTPVKQKVNNVLNVPASPFLQHLGYGTGVQVYRFNRSPQAGKINSPWALKYLTKRKLKQSDCLSIEHRLNEEANILKKLDHPNIVGFRAYTSLPDGRKVLAMEDCTVSLGDLIETRLENEGTPFEAVKILKMIVDMASALDYLHTKAHLLHGDVKSHNILVKGNFDICKLCDFGVSLQLDQNGSVLPNNFYKGTELWSAPETMDEGKITNKADLFSLGLTIWEMLSLTPPHAPVCDESNLSSVNESIDEIETLGTRPDLPNIEFSEDYNPVLECFFILTEENPINRPSASLLIELLKQFKL
ncbi:lymphokine-activated killer T-cell-originated protein kinase-like [Ctenocephalides felis]|uniref:lymphokine-activated killer T-cell-originated protein kinase-like n=1 Tax=Ctenocephalides felis TaxID=7515 RepID=UPI000E6E3784|nr:lymphokine-activated killer T-cell-originated protein kinase-like [Ctenocephalides felis]